MASGHRQSSTWVYGTRVISIGMSTIREIGKNLLLVFLLSCSLGMAERPTLEQGGKIQVVTSIPDLADFTARIGGKFVSVESLAKGVEDPHGVPIKPSFVPKLNRADVLVVLGLDAEHSWLPALVDVARNPKILPGNEGFINCAKNIHPKQVPQVTP